MGKKFKKVLITAGVVTLMLAGGIVGNTSKVPFAGGITAYASEQTVNQSSRWEGQGDIWRLKTADGTGYVSNSWFQDNDSSWYMIDNAGQMMSGLISDQSTGKSYYLEINHNGLFGKMQTVDGVYNINGVNVYLTFDQNHNGSYGAIMSGLDNVRNAGVKETGLASIPTDSASTTVGNNQSVPEQKPAEQSNSSTSKGYYDEDGYWINYNQYDENGFWVGNGHYNADGYWIDDGVRDSNTYTEEELREGCGASKNNGERWY